MSRLIDADYLINKINNIFDGYMLAEQYAPIDFERIVEELADKSTIDPLDKVKQAREEIESNKNTTSMLDCAKFYNNGLDKALEILDKLIAESEK